MKIKKPNTVKEELAVYKPDNLDLSLEARIDDDTIWLTQKQMSVLFDKNIRTINEHIKNVFLDKELDSFSTIRKFRIVRKEGARQVIREVDFYNLDVIISVGYRVKSIQGTKFRIWATGVLKEHLLKKRTPNERTEKEISSVVKLIGRITESYELKKELPITHLLRFV